MTPAPSFTSSARWRYGFLCILLLLLAWNLFDLPEALRSQKPGRFSSLFVALMLLFNHVAFFCIRSPTFRRVATGLGVAWLLFACAYIFTQGFTRPHFP